MGRIDGFRTEHRDVAGLSLELAERGDGRTILFLQPAQGLWGAKPFLDRMAQLGRLLIPTHPGFGATDLPAQFNAIEDYAYLYLDLLEGERSSDVLLVASSFGGWIAAEMTVRDQSRIGGLILMDTLGFKFGDREDRDITDMHATPDDTLTGSFFHDPFAHAPDYTIFADEDLVAVARARENFAVIGWKPYMHNPKLRSRLHRITRPTLVLWGAEDGIVAPDYGRKVAAGIPDAEFDLIKQAGHFPYVEQPGATADRIESFVGAATS